MPAALDWNGLEARLRTLIECDQAQGQLVTSRGGRISRQHYLGLLIVAEGIGAKKLAHVFTHYEELYEVKTGPKAKLPEMRIWLESAYRSGSLEFLRGRLDRRPFIKRFNLRGGTFMCRHPEIRDLITSYDERAKTEGYLDAIRQDDLDRLREHLSTAVPLNKDRLTVNRTALWKACRPVKLLSHDPVVDELIRPVEERILSEARVSKIDPLLHSRRWNFEIDGRADLTPFLSRVGEEFARYYGSKQQSSSKIPYQSFVKAFGLIAASADADCRRVIKEAVELGRIQDERAWEESLYRFREELGRRIHAEEIIVTGANTIIDGLRAFCDVLAMRKVVPELTRRLQGFKTRRETRHRKSVAEASSSGEGEDTYLSFVRSTLFKYRNPEVLGVEADAVDFISSIARDAVEIGLEDPTEAVLHVLRERRTALQDAALAEVRQAMKAFEDGRALLEAADIDVPRFVQGYLRANMTKFQRSRFMRETFPLPMTDADAERSRANLLKLIEFQLGGVFPSNGPRGSRGEWGKFFHHRLIELGGGQALEPMLAPTVNSVCAVLTLYLLESGANVEVGRMLLREGVRPSDVPEHISVVGFKARARGKPIFADLPKDGPAATALDWLRRAGAGIAPASDDPDCMFIARIRDEVKVVTPHTYTAVFKRMIENIRSMRHLNVLPSMLRPSALLEAALANDGRMMAGMAIGQHTLSVSQGYQQKFPVRLAYEANIHRFQSAVEKVILEGVPEAAHRLGMSEETLEERARELVETGLGTFCRSALGRGLNERCASLSCWDDCPSMIIVARAEPIAWLQIWRESLRAVAGDWERDRPERWERLWLPWLCLVDVVEEQMARGPNLMIWREAEKRAERLKELPGFIAPQPW